uniref:Unannotated protein n=1 Tax=freshwater metagenome TaxID=449393 RepID=A0A6J7MPT5_9ZZZZ
MRPEERARIDRVDLLAGEILCEVFRLAMSIVGPLRVRPAVADLPADRQAVTDEEQLHVNR